MKVMMKGNEAIAEAALRGGLEYYSGYPITPQSEVMEYLSRRMPELNRTFVQAESEVAACNMIYGYALTGRYCMTSSSGPGFTLKQEGITFLCANQYPCVLLNVQRWGAGIGSLNSAQTDYLRDTRGGGNGGYRTVVLAPNSVQESVDLMYHSFELAEKYRNPVIVYSEANLGQMMESCEFPEFKKQEKIPAWGLSGHHVVGEKQPVRFTNEYFYGQADMMREKVELMKENEQRWESYLTEDAEYIFVAIGLPSRVVKDAVDALRAAGEKAGMIRPIAIWPFPVKAFEELGDQVKGFISVEMTDAPQMIEDVALASKKAKDLPVYLLATGQVMPKIKQIRSVYQEIKDMKRKAEY